MAVIKCKMCGGDLDISEGLTVCECEYCGTKQTVPTVDDEKKVTLFNRAGRLLRGCEFDKAAGVFESIVADFPEEAEAYWGLVLCKFGIEYVDDPATGKKVPTCHRSGFDSVMEDADFEQACENADAIARRQYREEAKAIEELRRGIIEVSGKEQPYDIFICYKETDENGGRTVDSVIAQDVYDALTAKGYRVFFSRITLEDKLGQEYEPYIFAALNSAKIMLAFGTDFEYFNAVWVKNEWSRFLKLMEKDKSKHLIPCYKGIDAYDMPKEFARLQAQDMGKVGAVQDLLRGIEKLLPKQKEEAQSAAPAAANPGIAPLLRRAFMFLEDGEWSRADEICERVLDQEPENAEAYLAKLMAALQVRQQQDLATRGKPYNDNSNYLKALRFGDEKLRTELKDYDTRNRAYRVTPPEKFEFDANDSGYTVCKLLDQELEEVKIPQQYQGKPVTAIGDGAFDGCESLTSVTIPDSVTTIGFRAFYGCESLTSVTIPDSVTTIGKWAFHGCKSLASVTIPDGVTAIGGGAFHGCNGLADQNGFVIIRDVLYSYCGTDACVTIPDDLTAISDRAFYGCKSLTSVTIPDGVTAIGNSAFSGCESLTNVTIPDGVTAISDFAFSECESLTSVTIPDSVTTIGEYAFYNCKSLTSVTIPDSVTTIGKNAFYNCESLTSVTIPDGVTAISDHAFWGCKSLTSVTIPDGVTAISDHAFFGCESLTSVTIPDSVTAISNGAFWDCKSLTSVTIPDSVTTIGEGAFDGCKSLTSVTIPDSVTDIGRFVFLCCENLKTIFCTGDYNKLRFVFEKNNANNKPINAALEQGSKYHEKQMAEERRRKEEEKRKAEEKRKKEEEKQRNYAAACVVQEDGTEEKLAEAARIFRSLGGFKDSAEREAVCQKAYEEKKTAREAAEREAAKRALTAEKARLTAELPTLKGLFSGGKRKQIEARLAEIDAELAKLQ